MSKIKLLICGVSGFIGRNLAQYFSGQDAYEVTGTYHNSDVPDIPGVQLEKVDLTRQEEVNSILKDQDMVIQAAATTSGAKDIVNKPYYHVTDNAVMNSLILRACYEHGVKHLVFFSCTVMYQSSDTPLSEVDFNANEELHKNYFGVGWTKVYVEKMCEFYSRLGRTKHTVIRHSNIYGPHDKYDLERSHVFGATMTKVMTAEGNEIQVWGSGEEERDLLHVDDLVQAVHLSLEKQENSFELFNAGCGFSVPIKELVQKIIDCSKKALTIKHDLSKPTIKTTLCLNNEKITSVLGWEPKIGLEEGIAKTMEWYKENILNTQ